MQTSFLAQRFADHPLFRALTGDRGQVLSSVATHSGNRAPGVPSTAIIGERPFPLRHSPAPDDTSDRIVARAETRAEWLDAEIALPQFHSLPPSSLAVARIIAARIETERNAETGAAAGAAESAGRVGRTRNTGSA